MKKLSALILAVCLFAAAFCFAAAGETAYTLTLNVGGTFETHQNVTDYELPAAEQAGKVFAGWRTERDGTKALYPAGATVTLTADATFEALTRPNSDNALSFVMTCPCSTTASRLKLR